MSEKVISSLNLPTDFIITKDIVHQYMYQYNVLLGKKGSMTRSNILFAERMAAINLIKYKRRRGIPVQEGFIYIISNPAWPSLYKVGMTLDVQERLASYQTYSPYRDFKVEHFRFTSNRRKAEKELHKCLKDYNVRGEWYEIPLLTAFKQLIQNLDC